MAKKMLGIIGGSGLYSMKELSVIEKIAVETPFGAPSEDVVIVNSVGRDWHSYRVMVQGILSRPQR